VITIFCFIVLVNFQFISAVLVMELHKYVQPDALEHEAVCSTPKKSEGLHALSESQKRRLLAF
jgi:hypothetical protein